MDKKQFHRRIWGVVALMGVLLLCMGQAMYTLQIVDGESYAAQSKYKITESQTVEAARGEIVDRYGRVLVSNAVTYQVTLNTTLMKEARNDILHTLIQVCREFGVTWSDTLPISAQEPFTYTNNQPFATASVQDDGSVTWSGTRLGRLAVSMGWVEKEDDQSWEEVETLSEEELLSKMYQSFGLDPQALGQEDARAVAGVLYELYLRSRDINRVAYIFAQDVDIDFITRVKELGLAGVSIEPVSVRQYHTDSAAHILGRVALMSPEEWEYYQTVDADGDGVADYQMDDSIGKDGVEKSFESYLRGSAGVRVVERNTDGKVMGETWRVEPEPGDNVVLTIDIELQRKVEETLAQGIQGLVGKTGAEGGACVVLDVDSAEVLAITSYPTYSLANYSADYTDNATNPLKPLYNRAIQGTYAPGSIFKMITAVAALEEGVVTPSTQIYDSGIYTFYSDYQPRCWYYNSYGRGHGLQNVSDAIKNSCNYYFYEVGRLLGIKCIDEYAAMFGLGQKTGIELDYESSGVVASPEYTESLGKTWYEGSTLPAAIGQESTLLTPIQMANYIATLVNGGTRYQTHLLKEVKSSDYSTVLYTQQPNVLSTVEIKDENLGAVKAGMLALTQSGSVASAFRNLDVEVGAKTGSAQVDGNDQANATFVCFAPYDDPQVAIAIVVEKGGSGSELGVMAAQILEYYFSAQESSQEMPMENTLIR